MIILNWLFRLLASGLILGLVATHNAILSVYQIEDINGTAYVAGFFTILIVLTMLQTTLLDLKTTFKWLSISYPTLLLSVLFRANVESQNLTSQNQGCAVFVLVIGLIFVGGISLVGALISLIFMWIVERLSRR